LNEALITFDRENQSSASSDSAEQAEAAGGATGASSDAEEGAEETADAAGEAGAAGGVEGADGSTGTEAAMAGAAGEGADSDYAENEAGPGGGMAGAEGGMPGEAGAAGMEGTAAPGGPGSPAGGAQIVIIRTGEGYGSDADNADDGTAGGAGGAGTTSGVGGKAGGYGSGNVPGGVRTGAERIVILEGQLNERLAQFDGMILEQRGAVIRQDDIEGSAPGGGAAGGGSAGAGETESAPVLVAMAKGSRNSNSGGGAMPNLPEDNRQGEFGAAQQVVAEIPADIPDGSDDDVVARQLREAAMKEPDPQLREKLWDEYRKYKRGVISKK
jgi:hypothetical protein